MKKTLLVGLALLFSCEEILTVPNIENEEVQLLSPTADSNLTIPLVKYSWEKVENASNYRLQVFMPSIENATQVLLDTLILNESFIDSIEKNGQYQWRVRAENSGYNSPYSDARFSVTLPSLMNKSISLLSPTNMATLNDPSILFSWESVKEAQNYRFQLASPNFTESQQFIHDTLLLSSQLRVNLNSVGPYEWRVRAENEEESSTYGLNSFSLVNPLSSLSISLSSPINAAVLNDPNVVFNWEPIEGISTYHIQIATPSFDATQHLVLDSLINQNQLRYQLTNDSIFQWRVRAENSLGVSSYSVQSFTVVDPLSSQSVKLLSPAENTTLKLTDVSFNWELLPLADRYKIQIATPDFDNPLQFILDAETEENQINVTLPDNHSFQWRVKGINETTETAYTMRSLKVSTISTISSETIQLVAPTNGSTLSNTAVNFNWAALKNAETYHIQVATPSFANADQILVDQETPSTFISASLQASSTYEWRVKAINAISETGYSLSSFTIK